MKYIANKTQILFYSLINTIIKNPPKSTIKKEESNLLLLFLKFLLYFLINFCLIYTANLLQGQDAMKEEVFFRRTGALLPPKEKWFTSPELLELDRFLGRENVLSYYNATELGKSDF